MDIIVHACVLILIWLVQVIIYPSFKYTSEADFPAWHSKYTRLITFFVLPLMFIQLGISFYQITIEMNALNIAVLVIIVLVWLSTFIISVPLHNDLQAGKNIKLIAKLVKTNWYRTILWTAVFMIELIALFEK